MRSLVSTLALVLTLAFAAAVGAAPDKVKLLYKAQAGQVARYRSEATLQVEFGGTKVATEIKDVEKVTFAAVAASGDLTLERETISSEAMVNGQKLPSQDSNNGKSTVVMRANGTLVSMKSSTDGAEETKLSVRMFGATNPVFPADEVGVGSKWTQELKADVDTGQEASKADYELQAFEKVDGIEAAKIKVTYRETLAKPALGSSGTAWVELSSGDTLKSDLELENVPFGPPDMPVRRPAGRPEDG